MSGILAALLAISPRQFADQQRLDTWSVAVKAVSEYPFFGIGPNNFLPYFILNKPKGFGHEVAGEVHNDILEVAATCGLIGLAAYLWLVASAARLLSGSALAALVGLFVNLKFSPISLEVLVLAAVIVGAYEVNNA